MQDKSEFIRFEDRASDHPFVEKVWRCHSERADSFLSVAANNFEMAITRLEGKSFLTLRRQIERARYATNLLREGASIFDVVVGAGYFDQAHLTRSLKHFIGETPTKIIQGQKQLSFLYNTNLSAEAIVLPEMARSK